MDSPKNIEITTTSSKNILFSCDEIRQKLGKKMKALNLAILGQ